MIVGWTWWDGEGVQWRKWLIFLSNIWMGSKFLSGKTS
uniref:Uncharacterized protein n=1 Tax=Rhizophora mucronata TaxID=61149 RepID=A0A2P2PVL5_RHIMU